MAVITISRQFGAGGKTLGNIISKKLDYVFIDDQIIQMVAKKARVSTDWVKSIEQEAGGKLLKFMSGIVSKSFIDRILDDKKGYIDEEVYVEILHQIITKVADEGNALILGRGSQYILRDHKDVFHVLLVADMENRIKFMEDNYDLSNKQAIQVINSETKRRANLYKKFGKEDYDQPALYHLVINRSKVSIEKSAELVCKLVE
ncbi:MAG: cytidylate kinase-like family protein [Proteobacteria bacterium]|nr:cytidylate kinase-like family protein [Pseudomonadota bacterium]MBU1713890.1 cytidylate kinase-like family protein [Pseudomonadota bacterium]